MAVYSKRLANAVLAHATGTTDVVQVPAGHTWVVKCISASVGPGGKLQLWSKTGSTYTAIEGWDNTAGTVQGLFVSNERTHVYEAGDWISADVVVYGGGAMQLVVNGFDLTA